MACDLVAYENVYVHTGTTAAHLYAALRTTVQMHAYANDIQFRPISVQAGKAALTGRANASKELSVFAVQAKFKIVCDTHDHADAIGVALAAAAVNT
jgi:Holliday junction resolvasome RuvABC endonuclease subunit